MIKKYYFTLVLVLLASAFVFSQQKTDEIDIKKLTQADMERIYGDLYKPGKVFKTAGDPREIKEVIINGNKITTVVFNYGSICKPNYLGGTADLVWKGLGYGFEFGPLAAGEVTATSKFTQTDTAIHIIDDSFVLTGQGSYSPDGTLKWGWLPKTGYADPNQKKIATLNALDANGDGKPDSWPDRWYSAGAGKYVWPAFLGDQATAPDEEVYYVMDDYTNLQQDSYYPFVNDSTKRGMGLDCEVRMFQYNNPLAENILFLVYQITNASDKTIKKIYFGMHGDPHVGGAADYSDDLAFFIPPTGELADPYPQRARSMVYAWDKDGKGTGGAVPGYFGWKFLESPTNSNDGIDNDDDGILDESPYNSAGNYIDGISVPVTSGIINVAKYTALYGDPKPRWAGDENGNWDPARDDIGIDGIGPDSPNYPGPDYGEGDGKPSQAWYLDTNGDNKYEVGEPISDEKLPGYKWAGSEPNFGLRDVAESDQIGLTSFHAAAYTNSLPNVPKNATLMWEWLSSDTIDPNQNLLQNPGDNIFNFGTGPMVLDQGATQRFSMAILFGSNLSDLVLTAQTSALVLEANYRFAQPPAKPIVKAAAGDKKVTLFWDAKAESSIDPLSRKADFEGYKIYRSRDYTFADVFTITDGYGIPFLGQPLVDGKGKKAQFDLIDSLSGFHPVEYKGRAVKYYLGDNTGLVHQYVDTTVQNGVTYYYAVVAYDGGSTEPGREIAPTETQCKILKDPITSKLSYDVNTLTITPHALPDGVSDAIAGVDGSPVLTKGYPTGSIKLKVLDNYSVLDKIYKITFADSLSFKVLDSLGVSEPMVSKDTIFVSLRNSDIQDGSFSLYDASNNLVDPSKYFVNNVSGKIKGTAKGSLVANQTYTAKYKYYPVALSKLLNGEDANPSFNGSKIFVYNDSSTINYPLCGYVKPITTTWIPTISSPAVGGTKKYSRADYEIRFNDLDTLADGTWAHPADTIASHRSNARKVVCPFTVWNVSENVKAKCLIYEAKNANSGKWDINKPIVIQPQYVGDKDLTVSYQIGFSYPPDSLNLGRISPKAGDVYRLVTKKPFAKGDEFVINEKPAKFESSLASTNLDKIYVVPNPYVAYSISENPGRTSEKRGDRELQFRNLPPKCTIRIFTITGELVQTIYKDDMSSIASWDLLSNESQRIAYGVYIYHVDAPGVGEKIGRIAVIK